MAKAPLYLVPTAGKKLTDVANNVELQAALVSTLLLTLVRDNPTTKEKMIAELRGILAGSKLSSHQTGIYAAALQILKNIVVTTG